MLERIENDEEAFGFQTKSRLCSFFSNKESTGSQLGRQTARSDFHRDRQRGAHAEAALQWSKRTRRLSEKSPEGKDPYSKRSRRAGADCHLRATKTDCLLTAPARSAESLARIAEKFQLFRALIFRLCFLWLWDFEIQDTAAKLAQLAQLTEFNRGSAAI